MYLVTYQAALATGSVLAGLVAGQLGIPVTLFSAAAVLVLAALVAARMGLPGVGGPAQGG
jgi:predicted MFS family arabinose efflux permease